MDKRQSTLPIIRKYWKNTPEFFSEKYENNIFQLLLPVNAFLFARRKKALEFASGVKGRKVLDVGCGHGIFMVDLIKRGAYVVGIDYSPKMIQLAKRELFAHKISKKQYKLVEADATKLPFKDHEFDLILATGLTD
jgi:ubiquinone/menaquinone biosynthesis C-methylase UbiE